MISLHASGGNSLEEAEAAFGLSCICVCCGLFWKNEKKKKMLQKLCGETGELLLVVDDVRVGELYNLYKPEPMKVNI